MRIPRLYCPVNYVVGSTLSLTDEQAHYVLTVLRMKNRRPLELFNGQGLQAQGTLTITSRRSADIFIEQCQSVSVEPPFKVALVQGISKGDRMDYTLQKCVELGVFRFQPVFTEFCDVKLSGDKLQKKQRQWQDIVISACEQSNRTFVPEVAPAITLTEWMNTESRINGITLHPYAEHSLSQTPNLADKLQSTLSLAIGPEGGFSEQEINALLAKGVEPVRLGPRILRTETAGPSAMSALNTLFGDF